MPCLQQENKKGAFQVADPDKQKELQIQDEEEDYLDEASIYAYGSKCPMPLRLIACVLLQEITTFLRETYQNLPKSSKIGGEICDDPLHYLTKQHIGL